LKSLSMASTSASLGVLGMKRPVILCMRCMLQGGRNCERGRAGVEEGEGDSATSGGR
jgi:hypothetical protein